MKNLHQLKCIIALAMTLLLSSHLSMAQVTYIIPDIDGNCYAVDANGVKSSQPVFSWASTGTSSDAQVAAVQTAIRIFFAAAQGLATSDVIPTQPRIVGDVNGDSAVDVADISTIISIMAGAYEQGDDNNRNLELSLKRWHKTGTAATDFTQTGMLNPTGLCYLPPHDDVEGSMGMGVHLFRTEDEVRDAICNTQHVDDANYGEGQFLVDYHSDLCLDDLIEVHFTDSEHNHRLLSDEEFADDYEFEFELVPMHLFNSVSDESAHAALYQLGGKTYLHPQDPYYNGSELTPLPYSPQPASEVCVNRVPVIRVSLVRRADDERVAQGYIPVRITKEAETAQKSFITIVYSSSADWSVGNGDKPLVAFRINWRQIEEDLMSHPGLGVVLDVESFNSNYIPVGSLASLDQFEAIYDGYGEWSFTPCDGFNQHYKIGNISFIDRDYLQWTVAQEELEYLAGLSEGYDTVYYRAVMLRSSSIRLPDIYVILSSGVIH